NRSISFRSCLSCPSLIESSLRVFASSCSNPFHVLPRRSFSRPLRAEQVAEEPADEHGDEDDVAAEEEHLAGRFGGSEQSDRADEGEGSAEQLEHGGGEAVLQGGNQDVDD